MEIERKAVVRALKAASLRHVRVIQTGIGREAVVRELANAAAAADRGSLMILAGACGGLAATEDVPNIARVIDEHGGEWVPRFAVPAGVTLAAVDRIVATPADKRSLEARTGAAIVDMETHAFAAECERRGFSWTVVRGVSDTPQETLPAEVLGWVKPDGGTRAVRAAIDLAIHPSHIPHIIGVVRRANRVLPKVGARVAEIAKEWESVSLQASTASAPASGLIEPGMSPLPIPDSAQVAIFFGGTFDPPHTAHIELPRRAREAVEEQLGCKGHAWLVYVPAARSPHKADGPIASDSDRVEMLGLALREVERAAVWDDELVRANAEPSASYTVETLERARAWLDVNQLGHVKLRMLLGADQAAAFHRWREPRRILKLAEPIVMARGDDGGDAAAVVRAMRESGFWNEDELMAWGQRVVPVGRIDASATQIRQALAAGTPEKAAAALPAGVADYIRARGLYGPATRDG